MLKPTLLFLGLAAAIGAVTCARAGNTGPGTDTCQGSTCMETTPNGSVVNVYADPSAASRAAARSSATGGSGGSASAVGGGATVTVNNSGGNAGRGRVSELRTVGVAPDIVANATAPCRVAVGAGGGWLGGALSLTGSVLDEGCDARADAAMLMAMGRNDAALNRLCQKPETAQALGCAAVVEAKKPQGYQH